jgi:flagellar motility protein MotE (MotC chaperone)
MAKGKKKEEETPAPDKAAEASEASEDSAAEKTKAKSGPSPIILAVSALVAFVVFLGIFSFTMGVFDEQPPEDQAATEQSSETHQPSSGQEETADEYVDDQGDDAEQVEFNFGGEEPDTMAEVSWIESEKKKIQSEKMALAIERKQLETLRREVEGLLAKKNQVKGERVAYLAKLFDGMKQDEISKLMAQLDNSTIVAVLPKMKVASASKVLAMLPPERAARITTILLGLDD